MNDEINEIGPIDYILVEWASHKLDGSIAHQLTDLVDRGLVNIIDLLFIHKTEDGTVVELELSSLGDEVAELSIFEGASSGLLSGDDVDQAAGAMTPGSSAALLIYENAWAAPFAAAVRRSGGQLVADGRIPVQAIIDALDAVEQS